MKEMTHALQEAIGKQLKQSDYDVDIVPIPSHGDRMLRARTIEDLLEDFESPDGKISVGYLVQFKPKRIQVPELPAPSMAKANPEGVYQASGKLNVPFLVKNADLLYDSGEYVLARNIYKAILQSGECTGSAHFRIGKCFESEGRMEEARKHYEESVTYHPTLECFQRLSALLIRLQRDLEAAEMLERALNLKDIGFQTRFEIHKACGNSYARAQKSEDAERHFQRALEINATADEVRSNLGALCLQMGRISEARRHFQDALASNPENDKALTGMGSCAIAEKDKRAAHDYFAQSLEIELNNPTAIFHLVKCAYELKNYATAARLLGDYVQIAPVNPNLIYSLAGLQFHLGKMEEARSTAARILTIKADHTGAKELLKLIERLSGESHGN